MMKKIIVICMMLCCLVACSTEDLYMGAASKGGIKLTLTTENFEQVTTRAADADNESKIENLIILEFKDGTLAKKVVFPSGTDFSNGVNLVGDKSLDNLPKSTASSPDKENQNFVYVLANISESVVSSLVEKTSTVNDLKNLSFAYDKTQATLPMVGGYYGGIENGETSQISVELTRCVAKINFTVNVCEAANFTDESGTATAGNVTAVKINSITLCNVPTTITPYPVNETTLMPATMDASNSNDYEKVESANTYVAYMPENHRGIYDVITSNKDKHPAKCVVTDEESDKSFTYFLVDLDYTFSSGAKKNAAYRIYLGGNETSDMNILRNTQYNVTTDIYGANEADTRINPSVVRILPEDADNANCYMVNSEIESERTLTIPLGQVKLGWDKIKNYDASETVNIDKILGSGKWKVKTLWKTWQGENITGTKAANFDWHKPKATLTIPAGVDNGNNAVVALVSEDESETYWSWHIWLTDYKPSATGGTADNGSVVQYPGAAFASGGLYYGKYVMDRNLGAVVTGMNDVAPQPQTTEEAVKYYGLNYQYGRKDPFVASGDGTDDVRVATFGADNLDNPLAVKNVTGASMLASSVRNPNTFYARFEADWTAETDNLWDDDGEKSVFDPCPVGWRVHRGGTDAKEAPWSGFTKTNFVYKAALANQRGTAGRLLLSTVWFPQAGCLSSETGALDGVTISVDYWTSTLAEKNGYRSANSFSHAGIWTGQTSWEGSYGFKIRCVQDWTK